MRIALGIEYNGHGFHGWQWQANLPTLQGHLQEALSKIAGVPIQLFCAGRTDAGVHATGQVAHFDSQVLRPLHAWTQGTNSYLPAAIAVRWAKAVPLDFHARFSALSRCYRYVIYNHSTRPAILSGRATWKHAPLDMPAMQKAADYLIGENDFTSFRSANCESPTAMRNIKCIKISSHEEGTLWIDMEANAFLHHMVRNIVGVLFKIGMGLKPSEWIVEVLRALDRRAAAETAPAAGLYLVKVCYPESYALPAQSFKGFIS